MTDTVIFDIGNVLMDFDYMPYVWGLFGDENVIRRVNGAIWDSGCWADLDRGADPDEVLARMIKAEPDYREEIILTFKNVGRCMSRAEYAIPWIRELKERGYRVLFLSNYSHYVMEAAPEVLDFLEYMDGGVFSCEVGMIKPEEGIYKLLCERYGLIPENCVFLDDSPSNVEAARRLGMKAILFEGCEKARPLLEAVLKDS